MKRWSIMIGVWSVRLIQFSSFAKTLNLLYTLRRLCFQLTSSAPPSMVRSRVKLHESRIFFYSVLCCIFVDFLIFLHVVYGRPALKFTSKHAPNLWSVHNNGRTERSRVRLLKQESLKAGQSKVLQFQLKKQKSQQPQLCFSPKKKPIFFCG